MRHLIAIGLVSIGLGLTGCASDDGMAHLNVQKLSNDEQFTTSFERALFTESPGGTTDLVLLTGDANPAIDGAVAGGAACRQVVHVRVLWTPTRTIRVDSPSSGNAMIDWVVSADDKNKVTYTGSCWARVSVDGDEASVDLRGATINVRQITGTMTDPLQRATLAGKFTAKRSDAVVRAYIDEMNAADHHEATAISNPPARTVVP